MSKDKILPEDIQVDGEYFGYSHEGCVSEEFSPENIQITWVGESFGNTLDVPLDSDFEIHLTQWVVFDPNTHKLIRVMDEKEWDALSEVCSLCGQQRKRFSEIKVLSEGEEILPLSLYQTESGELKAVCALCESGLEKGPAWTALGKMLWAMVDQEAAES